MPDDRLEKLRAQFSPGAIEFAPAAPPPPSRNPSLGLERATVINKYSWIRQEGLVNADYDVLEREIGRRCQEHLTRQGGRRRVPWISEKNYNLRVLAWDRFTTVQTLILTSLSQVGKALSQLDVLGIGYDETEEHIRIADRWQPFDSFTLVTLCESGYFDAQSWDPVDRNILEDLKNNRAWSAVSEHLLVKAVWDELSIPFKAQIKRHEHIAELIGACDAFEFFITMIERDIVNPFVEVDSLHFYLDEFIDRTLHNFQQDEPDNPYFQDIQFMERFRLAYRAQTERGRILRYEQAAGVIYANLDQFEREWDVEGNKLKHLVYRGLGIFEDEKRIEFMRLRVEQRYKVAFASRRDPRLFTIRLTELLNALGVIPDVDEAFRSGLVIEFISLDWDYIRKLDAALKYLVGEENMGTYLSEKYVGDVGGATTHDMEQVITSSRLFGGLKRKTEAALKKLFGNASDYTPKLMKLYREQNREANELRGKAAKITDQIVDQEKAGRHGLVDELKVEFKNIQRKIKDLTPWLNDERAKDLRRVIERLQLEIEQKKDESKRDELGIPTEDWGEGTRFMTPGDPRRLKEGGRLLKPPGEQLNGQSLSEFNAWWAEYEATLKRKSEGEAERRETERKKADNTPFKGFRLKINGKTVTNPAEARLQRKREREKSERESKMELERQASVREQWAAENKDRIERERREEDERKQERDANARRSQKYRDWLDDQRLQWSTWGKFG